MGRPRLDSGQQEGEEEVVKLMAAAACVGEAGIDGEIDGELGARGGCGGSRGRERRARGSR